MLLFDIIFQYEEPPAASGIQSIYLMSAITRLAGLQ